ncbi:hypothetical protein DFH09DRAFT_1036230 [Mycena vulgaris]|nr:hypothetical protein DFH09DRAFT_1371245 [Mycena vulgaris]KAJ6528355.1 hypothetical protein DFH09DRAFT_995189 [Mycena vulgaris]KAJ6560538.1 hypothetical protein DFH09DRAFT_1036227 [Mycena vulgaris]KAJ6560540.1 hypothetical protein DFH09DRAFT_1036230 [Mycena vulgaris]
MKLTATFATFAAFFTALASASVLEVRDSCNRGGVYCGTSLLNKGNYRDHIIQVLEQNGQPTDEAHIDNSLFDCLSGGDISLRGFCANGCGGTTTKDPDFCL